MSQPRQFVAAGGQWPEGPFDADTPGHVLAAAAVAQVTSAHIAASGASANAFADRAGIARGTLSRVLSGYNLPDLRTLYRIEEAVGKVLWRR